MELRDHRLMSYRGVPNWPPVWIRRQSRTEQQTLRGKVGILQELVSTGIDYRKSFLYMEHEGVGYIGCLIFSDHRFCRPIVKLLRRYCGYGIKNIGGIDLDRVLIRSL
jgi:hypothetical protein